MSEPSENHCETCFFWNRDEATDEGISSGWCHRWPPVLIRSGPPISVYDWLQPITTSDDWCGEWKDNPISDEQVDKLILSATENANERSKNFSEFLDWATKEVASWPEWKRNVLGNSIKAQNDTPRKPVVND